MDKRLKTLADKLLAEARARQLTYFTAESCSLGKLAAALATGEGASTHVLGGVVAYTKQAKTHLLDVEPEILRKETAVCAAVAEKMATGALRISGATATAAITGVAGPAPDEDGNPVGLVFCAAATADVVRHRRLDLAGYAPEGVIDEACLAALQLMLEILRA